MIDSWSKNSFYKSQLDSNFDEVYARTERSLKSFMETWCDYGTPITINKNRGVVVLHIDVGDIISRL
jgi:hypothetical protein